MKQYEIRAVYTQRTIRVYQAYSDDVADEAVKMGTFGPKFKMNRMTWIKPSFLWMMYRSGWGAKENQERILAMDLKREGFDYMVQNAVLSTYRADSYGSLEEWKQQVRNSDVRCQWDPERDVFGNPLDHRSLQIGIRGEALKKYVNEWIDGLTDITEYVGELRKKKEMGEDVTGLLPDEKTYEVWQETRNAENGVKKTDS